MTRPLGGAAARRYARALFALAEDDSQVEAVRGELDALGQTLDASDELRRVLFRPLRPAAQRRAALQAICKRLGSSAAVRNFLSFLVDQRRIIEFGAIRDEFARLADEAAGRTHAAVVAANELSAEQLARLRRALAAQTGKRVELSVRVDPSLLGGAVAKVGDVVFDGSLRTQLEQLRANLTKGR